MLMSSDSNIGFMLGELDHGIWIPIKVTISIPAFDLFLHPRITPFCIFSLTYSCTCLELFPKGQSMQVHDLAKDEWLLFTTRKWVESTHGNSDLQ
jgi:hypothetical protein